MLLWCWLVGLGLDWFWFTVVVTVLLFAVLFVVLPVGMARFDFVVCCAIVISSVVMIHNALCFGV